MNESKSTYATTPLDARALAVFVAQMTGKPVDDEAIDRMVENGFEYSWEMKPLFFPLSPIHALQFSNRQRAARRRKWHKKASMV